MGVSWPKTLGVKESLKCMIFEEFFSESRIRSGRMPEGGGQGGGGGGHAVLEGSYELHDTVGTGGFAKVISRLSKFKFCLYHCYSLSCKSLMATWVVGLRNCQYCQNSFLPSACRQVFLRSWLKLLFSYLSHNTALKSISHSPGKARHPPSHWGQGGHQDNGQKAAWRGLAKN